MEINSSVSVVIYPSRNIDIGERQDCYELFNSDRISIIYLDELGDIASLPISIATIKLIIENEETTISTARELINQFATATKTTTRINRDNPSLQIA